MERYKELIVAAAIEKDWNKVRELVPEMADLWTIGEGKANAGEHTQKVLENLLDDPEYPELSEILIFAATLHDIGKIVTQAVHPDGHLSFHGHESHGAEAVRVILPNLGFSSSLSDQVAELVALHMWPLNTSATEVGDKAIRRLCRRLGDNVELVFRLAKADLLAHEESPRRERELANLPHLWARVKEIWQHEYASADAA